MKTHTFERPLAGALALAVSAALVAAPATAQQEDPESPQQREGMQETARQQQGQGLMSTAQERSELSLFVAAVQQAGLEQELEQNGPYTVFAPSDEALRNHLDDQQLQRLTGESSAARTGQQGERGAQEQQRDRGQQQEDQQRTDRERPGQQQETQQRDMGDQPTQQDRQELVELVRSHIVTGEWTTQQLSQVRGLQDVLGRRVAVSGGAGQGQQQGQGAERRTTGAEGQQDTADQQQDRTREQQQQQGAERETMARGTGAEISFGDAGVTEADIRASNGVLHVVDAVVQTSGPAQQGQQQDTEGQRRPGQQQDSAPSDTTGDGS